MRAWIFGVAAVLALAVFSVPEVIERHPTVLSPTLGCAAFMHLSRGPGAAPVLTAAAAPVRVLSAQQVSGYDAVVLEADGADALFWRRRRRRGAA